MKKIIGMLLFGLVAGAVAEVEYGYFAPGEDGVNEVSLAAGEHLVILANYQLKGSDGYGAELIVTLPSGSSITFSASKLGLVGYSAYCAPGAEADRTIIGPCTVTPKQPADLKYAAFKIIRPDAVVNTSPMNIISLPDDNNGDVELLVESSTDLQNWTPVYSGSAGTSNNAAFFRTRLIQN